MDFSNLAEMFTLDSLKSLAFLIFKWVVLKPVEGILMLPWYIKTIMLIIFVVFAVLMLRFIWVNRNEWKRYQ